MSKDRKGKSLGINDYDIVLHTNKIMGGIMNGEEDIYKNRIKFVRKCSKKVTRDEMTRMTSYAEHSFRQRNHIFRFGVKKK